MSMGINKARHDNLSSEVDIAVADVIIRLPLINLGDPAGLAVNLDGDIIEPCLRLWVKKDRGMKNHHFAYHFVFSMLFS